MDSRRANVNNGTTSWKKSTMLFQSLRGSKLRSPENPLNVFDGFPLRLSLSERTDRGEFTSYLKGSLLHF